MKKEIVVSLPPLETDYADPDLAVAVSAPYVNILLRPVFKESPWTYYHSLGVALIVGDLARELPRFDEEISFSDDDIVTLQRAALLHDIGKVDNPAITFAMLNANRPLTDDEFGKMKTHPREGFERIREYFPDESDALEVAQIMVAHHEFQPNAYSRVGGSPHEERRHSVSKDLLRKQQLVAMADTIEALFANRPYKPPWSPEEVRLELELKFGESFSSDFLDEAVTIGKKRSNSKG